MPSHCNLLTPVGVGAPFEWASQQLAHDLIPLVVAEGAVMSDNGSVGTVSVLDSPVYGVAQAAALLGLRADRVRAWLDGYQRGGQAYPPVVRSESTGEGIVTWGEFVELGYLREYRVDVSLQRIRPVIAELRSRYGTPYPLAHARPWVYDHELVLSVQEEAGLDERLAIVVRTGQELMLSSVAERFVRKVEFEGEDAVRWHPAGKLSPVVIDPQRAFGMPTVGGVATERIFELVVAGEPPDDVASGYELTMEQVRAACAFEETSHAYAA